MGRILLSMEAEVFGSKKTNEFEETIYCQSANSQDYIIHDYKDNIWNFLSTFRNLKIKACKRMWFWIFIPGIGRQ